MKISRWLVLSACALLAPTLRAAETQDADVADIVRTLHAGDTLESVLGSLAGHGHRVVYSSALVLPGMTLAAKPRARHLRSLLEEVLAPWKLKAVRAANGDWLIVTDSPAPRVEAPPIPETIETIDVSASRYMLASSVRSSEAFLDRQQVESMPHLADDAMRMLKVLPGVSGGDFSAALNIRGGRRDETLLAIDGAEIHSAFHFRDLDGALSVVDTHLVQGIDFTTGGLTAEHGDVMSGVVDMHTRRPRADDEYRSVVGVSFVSVYGRTGGAFADDRGSWLLAARRGYLDVLMEQVQDEGETLSPRYTDLFASVDYDAGERTSISGRLLVGTDDLRLVTADENDDVDSAGKGDAAHAWFTLDHGFSDALRVTTLLSTAQVHQTRDSKGEDDNRYGDVDAEFRFTYSDLRQDWSWTLGDRDLLRFGANAGWSTGDYEYRLEGGIYDSLSPTGVRLISRTADLDVRGTKFGAYAAWRTTPAAGLTTELGVRADRYQYPDGLEFDAVSPRANVVWRLGNGELRAAWGVLHQPQGIDALQVEDGLTQFFEPERAQNAVLGYSHRFDYGLSARLDVYRKEYSHLHPRFENSLDQVQLIPEGSLDRVRIDATEAEADGVELSLRREAERGFGGWIAGTFAKARDRDADRWAPRLWEQRRSLSFGTSWTGAKWVVSLAGLFHDGTPTTRLDTAVVNAPGLGPRRVLINGPRNQAKLGPYQRFDLRVNRDVDLRSGRLSYYLEVTNLLDRENPCCIEGGHLEDHGGQTYLFFDQSNWLPMMPSFGIQLEF